MHSPVSRSPPPSTMQLQCLILFLQSVSGWNDANSPSGVRPARPLPPARLERMQEGAADVSHAGPSGSHQAAAAQDGDQRPLAAPGAGAAQPQAGPLPGSQQVGEDQAPTAAVQGQQRSPGSRLWGRLQGSVQGALHWASRLLWPDSCILKRQLSELDVFRLPNQTNRLALIFDPLGHHIPFTFGVEVFEVSHKTTPHVHSRAHEMFVVLAGEGESFCGPHRQLVKAGDVVVFPPGSVHGIDNGPASRMYCIELMLPNQMFAELVHSGRSTGGLDDLDLCVLLAQGCSSGPLM